MNITFEEQRHLDQYMDEHGVPRELPNGGTVWLRPLGNEDYRKRMRQEEELWRKSHGKTARDRNGNYREALPSDVSETLGRKAAVGTIVLRIQGVPLRRNDNGEVVFMESTTESILQLFESPTYYQAIFGQAEDLQMTDEEKREVLGGNSLSASATT